MKVLKLDQGFSPVSVVDWKEAIKLVVLNKAEVIHEYENKYIRTTNCKYGMPSVIKLNNQFKRAKGYIRFNKKNVFIRDEWKCVYCNFAGTFSSLTIDHVIPRAKGGKTTFENCVTCCKECNLKKSNIILEKSGLILNKRPARPEFLPLIINDDIPEDWKIYIKR